MTPRSLRALPAGIWALGLGSLCMDTSSELVHSLLPVFMASVLGASTVAIGLVEGIAEATAALTKVASGIVSDRRRRRKGLVVLGYGLAALAKPMFPLASSMGWVLAARFVDRIGKGIRGAPRDALVADLTPPALRGAAYGLRQALDSAGAVAGPLLALAGMAWLAGDITAVLWMAVVPASLAVALLAVAVREPERIEAAPPAAAARPPAGAGRQSPRYWLVVALGAVFTLARFSEAFLVLRARSVGLAAGEAPLVLVAMNVAYAAVAYPAGAVADQAPRRPLLVAGLGMLVLGDVVLAAATAPWHALAGAALWGLHLALTQGLLATLVADAAPEARRGAAFGVFNLVTGVALLAASVLAGSLWEAVGPAATFLSGAVLAALAALGVLAVRPRARPA
jgi:MFS family permease